MAIMGLSAGSAGIGSGIEPESLLSNCTWND